MKNISKLCLLYSLLGCITLFSADETWVSLFDGKSLDGWFKEGGRATYEVRDGTIVGTNGPGRNNTFLCTKQSYADFELELDVFLEDNLNSGVQIRSKVRPETHEGKTENYIYGPQVEVELSPGESGYVYSERISGWMTAEEDLIKHETFLNGKWNHYRIVAQGPRIQTWINGNKISDLYDGEIYENHKAGFIGLQVHQISAPVGSLNVAWKNIRIREIKDGQWISIFNGRNLDGWTPKVTGQEVGVNPGNLFRVEGGILKVSYDAFDKFAERFGHLFYNNLYSHYKIRLEYRFVGEQAEGGPGWAYRNNGIMIHGQTPESMDLLKKFPDSIEVQLLGADAGKVRTTGNLCTPGTQFHINGLLIKDHCYKSNSKSYPGDQWVKAEVHVYGSDEIVHFINGDEVLRYQDIELDDGTPLDAGTISLQAESHGTEFRNIEVLPMVD